MLNKINNFLSNLVSSVGTWVLMVAVIALFFGCIFIPDLIGVWFHITTAWVANLQIILAVLVMIFISILAIVYIKKQG